MPLHKINGQWIHYEDTGGDLGPVVLAHGVLMDGEMFAPQIEGRLRNSRIITWDARCHGETENTDDPFTYWDLADDLKGLLDHLGIEKAVIGGMSQGGFIALRFALAHPERVSGLLLMGTQAGVEDPEKVATYQVMLDVWEAEGLNDQLAETIAAIVLGSEWPGRHTWIAKWRQKPRSLLRPAFQALTGRDDIHQRLGEIKAPALVVHGTADAAIDIRLAERLVSGLANSKPLVAIQGGGHASNLTHPKLVDLAVQQFLAELTATAPSRSNGRGHSQRSVIDRRFGERREPAQVSAYSFSVDRRQTERRAMMERRESWPSLSY